MNKLTNGFHVVVRLSSNRSQMTSKCDKNKKVTQELIGASVSLMIVSYFLLLEMATWNLFVKYKSLKK